jgi:glucosyl-dolichyl phosphate glucuronosyltransferase
MRNGPRPDFAPGRRLDPPQLSVVISTYNRCTLLERALRSVLAQHPEATPPFEVIVVDNNSTDATAEVVHRFARSNDHVRYVFEHRQGLSNARNAGIAAARAPLVAFTDDDVRAEPDWVAAIVGAFADHPDVDVVGGRVLPLWPAAPPEWLTRAHWAPLALVDYGEQPFVITADRAVCLVGANLACRRSLFDVVGLFATELQRVRDGIGSLEDHEFLLRLLRFGRKALYEPRVSIFADIQANRLEPAYHRRWHAGHGRFYALLRAEDVERTGVGTLFGVPAHLYRQAATDALGWLRAFVLRRASEAFAYEFRLRFFGGFFQARRRDRAADGRESRTTPPRSALAPRRPLAAGPVASVDPGRQ